MQKMHAKVEIKKIETEYTRNEGQNGKQYFFPSVHEEVTFLIKQRKICSF